jgi:pilus assembly protein CpaB
MLARRLIGALLLAILVSGLFTFWLSKKFTRPSASNSGRRQYVVTAKTMDAGEALHSANLKLIDWPTSMPLDGAFIKADQVEGRLLLYPLSSGEPILERQLAPAGASVGLATRIPDGMRAISLRSDQVVGVAGFLLPGTHVDVLVTFHTPGSPDPVTSTVLQDAQILATGQKMQPDPDGKPGVSDVVTLLAKPADAERLVLASTQGTIHFILRNGSDRLLSTNKPASLAELGDTTKPKPPVRIAPRLVVTNTRPKQYSVEVLRGDKQTLETF